MNKLDDNTDARANTIVTNGEDVFQIKSSISIESILNHYIDHELMDYIDVLDANDNIRTFRCIYLRRANTEERSCFQYKRLVLTSKAVMNAYKNDTIIHAPRACPLCRRLYNYEINDQTRCNLCPNKVFDLNENISCLNRMTYSSYIDTKNNSIAYDFWNRSLEYLYLVPTSHFTKDIFLLNLSIRTALNEIDKDVYYKNISL